MSEKETKKLNRAITLISTGVIGSLFSVTSGIFLLALALKNLGLSNNGEFLAGVFFLAMGIIGSVLTFKDLLLLLIKKSALS